MASFEKNFTDTLTLDDPVGMYERVFTDVQALVDVLALKNLVHPESSSLTMSEFLAKEKVHAESDAITFADSLTRSIVKELVSTIFLDDQPIALSTEIVSALNIQDEITIEQIKIITDTLLESEALGKTIQCDLSDSISTLDVAQTIAKNQSLFFPDTLVITDEIKREFIRVLVDTFGLADNLVQDEAPATFSDSMTLADVLNKTVEVNMNSAFSIADTLLPKQILKSLEDQMTIGELFVYTAPFFEPMAFSDSINKEFSTKITRSTQ